MHFGPGFLFGVGGELGKRRCTDSFCAFWMTFAKETEVYRLVMCIFDCVRHSEGGGRGRRCTDLLCDFWIRFEIRGVSAGRRRCTHLFCVFCARFVLRRGGGVEVAEVYKLILCTFA